MAAGLLALLDDVALIARAAAAKSGDVAAVALKTSAHSTGVVIDDAAVTPQYVQGIKPSRELPMIWRILKGSLINKLVIILPIALLLSAFAPGLLTPILMCGGTYLCFEGAEKIWHAFLHRNSSADSHSVNDETSSGETAVEAENRLVSSATTTDLILSAEIMVISLNAVIDQPFWQRLAVLIVVAIVMTFGVYGAVGGLVKMDDLGLAMLERTNGNSSLGKALVNGMPKVLSVISVVGTAAMLWVGGHIIIKGLNEFHVEAPYHFVHHLTESTDVGALQWIIETGCSMVFGFIVGSIVAGLVTLAKKGLGKDSDSTSA